MDSTITRLLIATKQLLEGLAKWSREEVSDDAISAIYVKLGNDFNVACAAFSKENIGMSELLSVPAELRVCLESCLSDPPSQQTLERHLPKVRQIIIGLLTGLREKQRQYRDGVAAKRAKELRDRERRGVTDDGSAHRGSESSLASTLSSSQTQQNPTNPPITPNSASRSRDELRKFVSQAQSVVPPPPPAIVARAGSTSSSSQPPFPPPNIPPPTLPAPRSEADAAFGRGLPSGPRPRATGRTASLDEMAPPSSNPALHQKASHKTMRASDGGAATSTSYDHTRANSSHSTATSSSSSKRYSGGDRSRALSPPPPSREYEEPVPLPTTPTTFVTDFSSQQSGLGVPVEPPPVTVRPPSLDDPPFTPTFEVSQNAAQLESLEALKQSDNLTRRASKRYSAYNMTKMTASEGSPSRSTLGDGAQSTRQGKVESSRSAGRELAAARSNGTDDKRTAGPSSRRTKSEFRPARGPDGERLPPPPLPTLPTSVSMQDLRNATIEEEEPGSSTPSAVSSPEFPSIPSASTSRLSRSHSDNLLTSSSSNGARPRSQPDSATSPPLTTPKTERKRESSSDAESEIEYPIAVYLQIGRDVKKHRLEGPTTIAALRVLFIERFQYNPGHADFPDIYLRDPKIGVQYELEDMSEVRNGSVISLNIDTVEQVKQHIDQGLAGLVQEIKELRSTVTTMRRASVSLNGFSPVEFQQSPAIPRPSERQFQDAARKVMKSKERVGSSPVHASISEEGVAQLTPAIPDLPTTPISPTSSLGGADVRALHVVGALKTQHEEVQNLRRELGVLRQVYVDFVGQTKSVIGNLRTQTSRVQNIAGTKVSTARAFIDAGKEKLEKDTTDLIARGDTLQDAIDDMRSDISMKKIRPRPSQVSEIALSLKNVKKARDDLATWISTVKPAWKTTWSDELANIIAEQKFLDAQEGFLGELEIDLQDSEETFHNIQQVVKQPPRATRSVRDFAPASSDPEESSAGALSTILLEVRGLQPDPERRLEAIEKAENARKLDLASRSNEFADELGGFVDGGKLKKSGGIEETERIRQAKSEATLRAMFNPAPDA
ncbi:hypothetical protein P7C70_g1354, partial [Phenoliferia sp. Uapishka_3]